ncbi:MAG: hypothetical protein AB7I24_12715, partial [Candidatus Nanopelagicales bacterium]
AWFVANPGQPTPADQAAALTEGYTAAFRVGAGFLVAATIITAMFLRIGKNAAAEDDEDEAAPVIHLG